MMTREKVVMVMKVKCGFVYSADDYDEDSGGGGDGSRSWTDNGDKMWNSKC